VSSKGTYIRTIAHDIGVKLGTGAYLKNLCRVRNGVFHVSHCVDVEELRALKDTAALRQYIRTDLSLLENAR